MTAAELSALPQPIRINCGDVAPQPHSKLMLAGFDSNRACAEPLGPSSRSFVLAALRALHPDTGVGSALSTPRSKQLKRP
jgi:hypothetical protein